MPSGNTDLAPLSLGYLLSMALQGCLKAAHFFAATPIQISQTFSLREGLR
jgi:hypothetical protein